MLLRVVGHGAKQAELAAGVRALSSVPTAWLLTAATGAIGLWLLLAHRPGSDALRLLGVALALGACVVAMERLGVTDLGLPW